MVARRLLFDQGAADDAGKRRAQLHLLQSQVGELHVSAGFLSIGGRDVPLCLRVEQLHSGGDIAGPQCLCVVELHLGNPQLCLSPFQARLSECERELLVARPELEQKVAFAYELASREVDLD